MKLTREQKQALATLVQIAILLFALSRIKP